MPADIQPHSGRKFEGSVQAIYRRKALQCIEMQELTAHSLACVLAGTPAGAHPAPCPALATPRSRACRHAWQRAGSVPGLSSSTSTHSRAASHSLTSLHGTRQAQPAVSLHHALPERTRRRRCERRRPSSWETRSQSAGHNALHQSHCCGLLLQSRKPKLLRGSGLPVLRRLAFQSVAGELYRQRQLLESEQVESWQL